MRKSNEIKTIKRWRAGRTLLAISLTASLAAIGCTTNQMEGTGKPERSNTGAPSSTPGTSYGPSYPTPMVSAANTNPMTGVGSQHTAQSAADQAAATMRARQAREGVILGATAPGPDRNIVAAGSTAAGSQPTNPAMATNPQQTVNSSLTSNPTAVINSLGDDAAALDAEAVLAAGAATGATLGTTTGATNGTVLGTTTLNGTTTTVGTAGQSNVQAETTAAAGAVTPGAFAGSGAAPTLSNLGASPVGTGSTTTATSTGLAATPSTGSTARSTVGTTSQPVSTGSVATGRANVGSTVAAPSSGSVVGFRDANGRIVITNTSNPSTPSTSSTSNGSRGQ